MSDMFEAFKSGGIKWFICLQH